GKPPWFSPSRSDSASHASRLMVPDSHNGCRSNPAPRVPDNGGMDGWAVLPGCRVARQCDSRNGNAGCTGTYCRVETRGEAGSLQRSPHAVFLEKLIGGQIGIIGQAFRLDAEQFGLEARDFRLRAVVIAAGSP